MNDINQATPDPGIPKSVFIRTAEKRLVMWLVALVLAIAPNLWAIVSHIPEHVLDRGTVFGTLTSIYLVTALGYFEARFVTRLLIREALLKWVFSVFGWSMWFASALCCVLSWVGTDVKDPLEWSAWMVFACGMLALAVVAEGFLAAEFVHWGRERSE